MMLWIGLAHAVDSPVFDVERGLHEAPFELSLTGDEPLLYSLDGGAPDLAYTGPLTISGTTVVRAQAADSTVATHTYVFVDDVLTQPAMDTAYTQDPTFGPIVADTLRSLPTVSIALDSALSTTELPVSFEYVEPGGLSLQEDCGAAEVGGHSLGYAKNNVRLYFRTAYGAGKLDADFFGETYTGVPPITEHDSLDLRGGSHDSGFYLGTRGQHLRNVWMDETELEMGHIAPHSRFVHVYENGSYIGLYQLRERFDAALMAEHLGGDEDDYAAVNGGRSVDGDGVAWSEINASVADFEGFREWVDVEQYLDYIVLNLFAANLWDWNPAQNWMAAGPTDPTSGWIFHSSDSDICLVYDPTTWALDQVGPAYSLSGLVAEAHPDFQMAMADALHRNLRADGALTSPRASERYLRLAGLIEDGVYAEAARWGYGAWHPVDHWEVERDYLVDTWLPTRTDELLADVAEAGWLVLEAPTLTPAPGVVPEGTTVRVEGDGTLWLRLDGGDPREPGGDVAAESIDATGGWSEVLSGGRQVSARLQVDGAWGPLAEGMYVVDGPSPVLLNEWNAVGPDRELAGGDSVLGDVIGNGGDWLELLVVEDVDLRGARLQMWDDYGDRGDVVLGSDPVFAEVRAGTLITLAEDLPEDLAYDPDAGDWRFHVGADFDVTNSGWQLAMWDREGRLLHGPVGEGVSLDGLSSREVGLYAATPTGPDFEPGWVTGDASTYGSPNVWDGGEQELSALRGVVWDTGETGDSDVVVEPPPPDETCGCSDGSAAAGVFLVVGLFALRRRRLGLAALALTMGCDNGVVLETGSPPEETGSDCRPRPEVCNDVDDDCDGLIDDADDDLVDGLPFFEDADGDGYGGQPVTACSADGYALVGGDCDDGDAAVNPGATELCDDIDQDCDGSSEDVLGASDDCPATSCLEVAEVSADPGAYWIELPSGTVAELWCDDGWTLGFLRNSAATGTQGDFGAGEVGLDGLTVSPAAASGSTTGARGWHDLNEFEYDELQLAAYASGAETYRSEAIPRDHLRIDFGEDGYRLYGGDSPYVWCGGDTSYTDSGVGAVDNPEGAYANCRGHGSLGSGWDFSESTSANQGLTLCGSDGSNFLAATWAGTWISYGTAGGAQAIWVR
ncbi:MAG: hypothetical protein GY913_31535 [Proteobacteria bacterium]|nr:hypothetical protein [Pseudomonadota bacterium]MCP4921453.1 hypothetical protein [Pseudomonadota bacterium]